MKPDERSQLIDSLLEGDISDADFLRLEAEMLIHPEVRNEYYERVEIDTLIASETQDQSAELAPEKVVPFRSPSRPLLAAGLAAAILVAATFGYFTGISKPKTDWADQKSPEPVAEGFGVVAEHVDARWVGEQSAFQRGEILPRGPLALDSGLVQIDLFSGVSLIVDGTANFEILSPMELRVDSGKVRARVPEQARGFRVHTTTGEVVDLGTEFALDVTAEHADVHVIDGEIEWHAKDRDMQLMVKGDALRATGESTSPLAHDPSDFAGIDVIKASLARSRSDRRNHWLTHSEQLAGDSRLLLYYPMNQSKGGETQLNDAGPGDIGGSIVRADRVSDRWGSPEAALDFTPAGSRVRVEVPGQHQALTLYCWARIDSLDRWFNSLFLTDGHEVNEPHWQILDDGRLFFSVKKNETEARSQKKDKYIYYSPSFWTPAQSGQWFQIATTYDPEARQVTHYINGELVSREPITDEWLVENISIGAASIGNWSEPRYKRDDPGFAIRNLNGVIDEFAIFQAALAEAEIRELYENGRP